MGAMLLTLCMRLVPVAARHHASSDQSRAESRKLLREHGERDFCVTLFFYLRYEFKSLFGWSRARFSLFKRWPLVKHISTPTYVEGHLLLRPEEYLDVYTLSLLI